MVCIQKSFKMLGIIIESSYHEIRDWNLFVFQAIRITDYDYGVRLQLGIGKKKGMRRKQKKERERIKEVSVVGRIHRLKFLLQQQVLV